MTAVVYAIDELIAPGRLHTITAAIFLQVRRIFSFGFPPMVTRASRLADAVISMRSWSR